MTARAEIPGTRLELASIAAGAVLALFLFWSFSGQRTKFDEAGLGVGTLSCRAQYLGHQLHCEGFEDIDDCIAGIREREAERIVLWLGNSQLDGVNQWAPGQETAPPILARRLRQYDLDLIAVSAPNITAQELLVDLAYLKAQLPIQTVIVPLVFTSFRYPLGVREELSPGMNDPDSVAALEASEIGRKILAAHRDSGKGATPALADTFQEVSEERLTTWLEEHTSIWAAREEVRGRLELFVFRLRNTVFRITPQSKRRVIPGNYKVNMEALVALLELARRDGIDVVTYVVPIRDDYDRPFLESEYDRFKRDTEATARRHGATFVNMESLVPSPLFGYMVAPDLGGALTPDFMHFQVGGHIALAGAMGDLIEREFLGINE